MKKIAIPIADNTVSDHFGHCDRFYLYTIEDNNNIKKEYTDPPPHQPGTYPSWLKELGITDVITGGIGQRAIDILNQFNINVFAGAPQIEPEEIIKQFLSGTLNLDANYCDH